MKRVVNIYFNLEQCKRVWSLKKKVIMANLICKYSNFICTDYSANIINGCNLCDICCETQNINFITKFSHHEAHFQKTFNSVKNRSRFKNTCYKCSTSLLKIIICDGDSEAFTMEDKRCGSCKLHELNMLELTQSRSQKQPDRILSAPRPIIQVSPLNIASSSFSSTAINPILNNFLQVYNGELTTSLDVNEKRCVTVNGYTLHNNIHD